MSIVKKGITLYSNLPTGGADEIAQLYLRDFKKNFITNIVSDSYLKPCNFLDYLYISLIRLPLIHKKIAEKMKSSDVLVSHHTWLTKSPYLLRYFSGKKIYICHEVPREFYDKEHIKNQSFKERVINFARLPIKYIDRKNLKSKSLIVIANSLLSKKLIDSVYQIQSVVIYPGINTAEFSRSDTPSKQNQVLSVGAINKLKRYDFLINVVSKVNLSIRPTLVLVGNGGETSYIQYLRKLAHLKGVDLKISVNASRAELVHEYLRSKVFLYAPISEPFGIVIEEAMASGLPLLVYKSGGGYVEILSSRNGFIMNSLNSEEWAEKLSSLLQNSSVSTKYSQYNLKYSNNFTDKKMTTTLIQKINSL
jgi:glycosyltransferase involved in cell wall biosynthesis